jgi:hypothetical protein
MWGKGCRGGVSLYHRGSGVRSDPSPWVRFQVPGGSKWDAGGERRYLPEGPPQYYGQPGSFMSFKPMPIQDHYIEQQSQMLRGARYAIHAGRSS